MLVKNNKINNIKVRNVSLFKSLSPQKVQHSDGYIVQVENRNVVGYFDSQYRALVEVDFDEKVGVYKNTLKIMRLNGDIIDLSPVEVEVFLQRMVEGIRAMGSSVEVC